MDTIKVDPKELVKLYTEIHNMFFGVGPTIWEKLSKGITTEEIVARKQYVIKSALVDLLNKGLEMETNLPKEPSPFKMDYEEICKGLNLTVEKRNARKRTE